MNNSMGIRKIRKVLGIAFLGLLLVGGVMFVMAPSDSVYAGPEEDKKPVCGFGESPDQDDCRIPKPKENCDPALPGCESAGGEGCSGDDCGLVDRYLNPIINFLAIIVGLVATISIVVGGIQYASSGDDPQKVAQAKSRIINAVIGLLAFLFLYSFLQWVVPGGFL